MPGRKADTQRRLGQLSGGTRSINVQPLRLTKPTEKVISLMPVGIVPGGNAKTKKGRALYGPGPFPKLWSNYFLSFVFLARVDDP